MLIFAVLKKDKASLSSDNTMLTIHNVTKKDLMNVQCNVTNVHGYIYADSYLNVLGELLFSKQGLTYSCNLMSLVSCEKLLSDHGDGECRIDLLNFSMGFNIISPWARRVLITLELDKI